jgi:hypothetical protein
MVVNPSKINGDNCKIEDVKPVERLGTRKGKI